MRYAVVINLDYENNPEETIKFLWQEISDAMTQAGFRKDGRLFSIEATEIDAKQLAVKTIEGIEGHLEFHRKHLHKYIKDFFGFDMENTSNLLLPLNDDIVVNYGATALRPKDDKD